MMNLFAIETEINNKPVKLLSLLDAGHLAEANNQRAVVGVLKNTEGPIVHQNIIYNPEFITFFHKTILLFAEFYSGLQTPNLNGFVYVVDERCTTPEKPMEQDIIGSFEVANGVFYKDSYKPNNNYQFISTDGLFKLPKDIEKMLFVALV